MTTQLNANWWINRHRTMSLVHTLFALSLLFGVTIATAAPIQTEAADVPHDDIVDVAVKAGAFKTLIAAVTSAGLVETLKADGPFTVFAPTDEAFEKLPAGTVEDLLRPENRDQLVSILTYHVVPGRIQSSDLLAATEAETVGGKTLPIGLRVGEATVLQADVQASNGVIHVIDMVLMPQIESNDTAMAMNLIRTAIDRGAPLYNQGQHAACASIYEVTARALVGLGTDLPVSAQRPLRSALERMGQSHDPSDRAWIMRKGLDDALAVLSSQRLMSTTSSRH